MDSNVAIAFGLTLFAGLATGLGALVIFISRRPPLAMLSFGLGFSGLIPTYIFTIREFFAVKEASWRVPVQLLLGGTGMAFGGWFAGYIFDLYAFYAIAFAAGLIFNAANAAILGFLVYRQLRWRQEPQILAA